MDKSGCYRDPVHTLENKENIGDIIWVQRDTEGFENDHPLGEDETPTEVDSQGYVRESSWSKNVYAYFTHSNNDLDEISRIFNLNYFLIIIDR
mgnify:CR=1 FL=1